MAKLEAKVSLIPSEPFSTFPLPDFIPFEDTDAQEPTEQYHEDLPSFPAMISAPVPVERPKRSVLEELADAIDLHIDGVSAKNRLLVLRRTLELLERTTAGSGHSKPTQELLPREMVMRIRDLVPLTVLNFYGYNTTPHSEGLLMQAVARYIRNRTYVIKSKKHNTPDQVPIKKIAGPVAEDHRQHESQGIEVDQALDKIEHWCNGWLEGRISDWTRMEQCLSD